MKLSNREAAKLFATIAAKAAERAGKTATGRLAHREGVRAVAISLLRELLQSAHMDAKEET